MGVVILVREGGSLVVSTIGPALPSTWRQVGFTLAMSGIAVLAGRSSNRAAETHAEQFFKEGEGI